MNNRFCALIGFVLQATICANCLAIETDPADGSSTTVYVAVPKAELHSGPAEDFYATGHVAQGASLEVFHRTDDNWLGVRPPEGSFSWVPATDAYLLPGGRIIEITNPSSVSWIGTSLGSAKQYRWQVQLKSGEQLAVLGEQASQGADEKEVLWYKIAPPSGEFRWIQAKDVSETPVAAMKVARTGSAASASAKKRNADKEVVTAAYQAPASDGVIVLGESSNYYDEGPMVGEVISGEGGVVQGGQPSGDTAQPYEEEFHEGEYIVDDSYGDVIYDDGAPITSAVGSKSSDPFAGWHAMDLGDDGLRFTFLERVFGKAAQRGPDPLVNDPFNLSMAQGTVRAASPRAIEQMGPPPDVRSFVNSAPTRPRRGGWRDPRTLGSSFSAAYTNSLTPTAAPLALGQDASRDHDNSYAANDPPGGALQLASQAIENARAKLVSTITPTQQPGLQRPAPELATTTDLGSHGSTLANSLPSDNQNWYGLGRSPTDVNAASASNLIAARQDLNQLQMALSEAVTQPMQLWSLQSIYDGARYLVEHGDNAIERGQARLLIERIEEFADLAKRSGYVALNGAVSNATFMAMNSVSPTGGNYNAGNPMAVVNTGFQKNAETAGNYDATGWLVPVRATSPGQPSYAIADQSGNIVAYVSAVPGLNLDRYLNQAVGITGLRGFLPQLQSAHIQAQRVTRLQ